MKLIILFSVLAVGMCAPLGETEQAINDVDTDEIRVKRAKEIMMFGNQQNEMAKDVSKRIDPSINDANLVDKDSLIVANELKDLPQESSKTEGKEESDEDKDEVSDAEESVVTNADTQETETGDSVNKESAEDETTEVDEAPVDNIDTTDNTEVALPEADDTTEEDMSFEDYLKELEKIQGENGYENEFLGSLLKGPTPTYRGWQPNSYGLLNYPGYARRYRRSQLRTFNGFPYQTARMLKRGHRAKRQTYDPEDFGVYLPYDIPYNYPVDDDDMAELLDLLDTPTPYDDTDRFVSPYETYSPYEEPSELEFESPIYVPPPKRQAGITFVPGIKRSPDFYPYFEEPETHFSNFIPQKRSMREYADAYQRVMELAAQLRQQEEAYPSEFYEGYRRRK